MSNAGRGWKQVVVLWGLVLAAGCEGGGSAPPAGPRVKLVPYALELATPRESMGLIDRDTTVAQALAARTRLRVHFQRPVLATSVWLHGQALGLRAGDVTLEASPHPGGWLSFELDAPVRTDALEVVLEPTGPDASLSEIEIWGEGSSIAYPIPEAAVAMAPYADLLQNLDVAVGSPRRLALEPEAPCGAVLLRLDHPASQVTRAYLVYEGVDLKRPVVLERSVNGTPFVGGLWLGTSTRRRTVIDELDPEALRDLNRVDLCLPADAPRAIEVSDIRLVTVLADGRAPLVRDVEHALAAALDSSMDTATPWASGVQSVELQRTLVLDRARLDLADHPAQVEGAWGRLRGERQVLAAAGGLWQPGDHELDLRDGLVVDALDLALAAPRPDLPAAHVADLALFGHVSGRRQGAPRIVVTYPRPDASGSYEHFGDRAYVAGFVSGQAPEDGPLDVWIDGVPVSGAPVIARALQRPKSGGPWQVTLTARLADGTLLERVLTLDQDRSEELWRDADDGGLAAGDAAFGAIDEVAIGVATPEGGGSIRLGSRVALEVPPGAVKTQAVLSIQCKDRSTVPPLDAGLINVTAPQAGAYRFRPPGTRFERAVKVRLPYDPSLLPPGTPPEDVRTWYYDDRAEVWKPLARVGVDRIDGTVVSETDHFTFMINAVLTMPEHPGVTSLDPNAMSDLKAALATAGVDLVQPPQVNQRGSAQLMYPLRLPQGRGAFQPSLALTYDSESGSGLMGVGWSLSVPHIAVDTRLGVPRYDGSDAYLLQGRRLLAMDGEVSCVQDPTAAAVRYRPEREESFHRILHCTTNDGDWWEVTDTAGTLFLYGISVGRLDDPDPESGRVAEWWLERVVDTSGNLTVYEYEVDEPTRDDPVHKQAFRYVYPTGIRYTGHVSAGTDPWDVGPFTVDLQYQENRPDPTVSGRYGFKTVVRRRLTSVEVRMREATPELVRKYVLGYREGALQKRILDRLVVYGAGANEGALPEFYRHTFEYSRAPSQPFSSPTKWNLGGEAPYPGDEAGLGAGLASSRSAGGSLGVSFLSEDSGVAVSASGSLSGSWREVNGRVTLVDVNGDRLPDRLVEMDGEVQVLLNLGLSGDEGYFSEPQQMSSTQVCELLKGLRHENSSSTSWGASVGATAVIDLASADVGGSWGSSVQDAGLLDFDGDGLVDFLGPDGLLLNRRQEGTLVPAYCLQRAADVATYQPPSEAGNVSMSGPGLHPAMAVAEWTAPYAGQIRISAAPTFLGPPLSEPTGDGVTVTVTHGADPVAERTFVRGGPPAEPIDEEIHVGAGQHLYFLVSSHEDVPLRKGQDARFDPLEEISFNPTVEYTSCSRPCTVPAGGGPAVDSLGNPRFRFALAEDFRLAGGPLESVTLPLGGRIAIDYEIAKEATVDAVRVCLQRVQQGAQPPDRACGAPGDVDLLDAAIGAGTYQGADRLELEVEAGQTFVLRMDSDLPVDPAALQLTAAGTYTRICRDSCEAPDPDEAEALAFELRPYRPLVASLPRESLTPLVVPEDGVLHLQSTAPPASFPAVVAAVGEGGLLFKHRLGEDVSFDLNVTAGQQIWFECVGPGSLGAGWTVSAGLEAPDGSSQPLDVPLHFMRAPPDRPLLGGGWRGWRFGLLVPEEGRPFDPEIFRPSLGDVSGLNAEELRQATVDALSDPDHVLTRALDHVETLLPRAAGTGGGGEGLCRGRGAFVSRDGATFLTAGTAHSGLRGQPAARLRGMPGGALASSYSGSFGGGLQLLGASLSVQGGWSRVGRQLMDFNGDGVADSIDVGDEGKGSILVRITDPKTLLTASETTAGTGGVGQSDSLTFSVGLGSGIATPEVDANNQMHAVRGRLQMSAGASFTKTLARTELADVNGDGLVDLVSRNPGAPYFEVRVGLGDRFAESADHIPVPAWSTGSPFDTLLDEIGGSADFAAYAGGIIGDLYQDLDASDSLRRGDTTTLQAAEGFSGTVVVVGGGVSSSVDASISDTSVELLDVTGDGLPDYVRKAPGDAGLRVMVNTGYGFAAEQTWPLDPWPTLPVVGLPNPVRDPGAVLAHLITLADLDHRADVLEANVARTDGVVTSVSVNVSIPIIPPFLFINIGADYSEGKWKEGFEVGWSDIDGDGFVDHVLKRGGADGDVSARRNRLAGVNLLTAVSRPLGGRLEIGYQQTQSTIDDPNARWVMSRAVVRDGLGGPPGGKVTEGHDFETTFTYTDPYYDRAAREFRGFAKVTQWNADGTRLVRRFYTRNPVMAGLLEAEETFDSSGRRRALGKNGYAEPVSRGLSAKCEERRPFFQLDPHYCESMFVPLEQITRTLWDPGIDGGLLALTTRQHYGYDEYGNVVTFHEEQDPGMDDDLVGSVQYTSAAATFRASHILSKPTVVEVRQGSDTGRLLRKRVAEYDQAGRMKTMQVWTSADGALSETTLEWNAYGGLKKVTAPPGKDTKRATVEYVYDAQTQTYPQTAEDTFGVKSTAQYDPRFGVVLRQTDPNGNAVVRTVDVFGRVTDVWGPYDAPDSAATVHYDYRDEGLAISRFKLPRGSAGVDGFLDARTFVDGLARTIQTQSRATVDGTDTYLVSAPQRWDAMGRVKEEGQPQVIAAPTSAPAFLREAWVYATHYGYDDLGRLTTLKQPLSGVTNDREHAGLREATTSIRYAVADDPVQPGLLRRRIVTEDALGRTHEEYRDLQDRVVAVVEHATDASSERLVTSYAYDPTGDLRRVTDAEGNETQIDYDVAGRRTVFRNPDAGTTVYGYDPAGHLTSRLDSNLGAESGPKTPIVYTYDIDRLTKIAYPHSRDVTFEYGEKGAAENGFGRIVKVTDEAGEETRGYGRLGEVTRTTRTVRGLKPGDTAKAYTTRMAYDSFGRMRWVEYPDGERVRYGYDAGGQVVSAVGELDGTRKLYVSDVRYDRYGQRRQLLLGNGTVTRYAYDPATRMLAQLDTRSRSGVIQSLTYRYDPVGNVKRLIDQPGAAAGSGRLPIATQQTFSYDSLDRLTLAVGRSQLADGRTDGYDSAFAYDGIHNMRRNLQAHVVVSPTGEEVRHRTTNHRWGYVYGDEAHPHRLTEIQDADTQARLAELTYDANGNTLTEAWSGGLGETRRRQYAWNEENRLTRVVDGGRVTSFLYDAGGDRVVKRGKYGETTYLGQWYTVRNGQLGTKHVFLGGTRVASKLGRAPDTEPPPPDEGGPVVDPSGHKREDPPGILIACNAGEGEKHGLESRCSVTVEGGAASPGRPRVRARTYWYHPDHLGSTAVVTGDDGQVYERLAYFPYGATWRHDGAQSLGAQTGVAYTYTAKPEDPETGLIYFGARYYQPGQGRWLSTDPALSVGAGPPGPSQYGQYSYANANPLGSLDPDGLNTVWIGGAGVEEATAEYSKEIVERLSRRGVPKPVYVPSSLPRGKPENIAATLWARTHRRRDIMTMAAITPTLLASNAEGGQRNLVGYSYGSIVAAQAALFLAEAGVYVDTVVLVGSPIPDDSDLMRLLLTNEYIGNVFRVDIDGDPFSGGARVPTGNSELERHFYYTHNEEGQQDALARIVGMFVSTPAASAAICPSSSERELEVRR